MPLMGLWLKGCLVNGEHYYPFCFALVLLKLSTIVTAYEECKMLNVKCGIKSVCDVSCIVSLVR